MWTVFDFDGTVSAIEPQKFFNLEENKSSERYKNKICEVNVEIHAFKMNLIHLDWSYSAGWEWKFAVESVRKNFFQTHRSRFPSVVKM